MEICQKQNLLTAIIKNLIERVTHQAVNEVKAKQLQLSVDGMI
jgi:hypothetical protein